MRRTTRVSRRFGSFLVQSFAPPDTSLVSYGGQVAGYWFSSLRASEAIHLSVQEVAMDCFAEPVIGRRFAPTRWLAMTVDTVSRSRGAGRARGLTEALAQTRAQGRPGARCTRGLVCNMHKEVRTRAYRSSGEHPAFPAQWFNGLLRALPGVRIPLATVVSGLTDGAGPVGPAHPPQT